MSLAVKEIYEFGEFRLDAREKILMRSGEQLEVTPKGFELLSVLVENHGRLLKKEELMEKVWAGSFVEESNLTFNIRQLRKILGDDAQRPTYIKTVRQHGYRFIADVKRISEEDQPKREAAFAEDSETEAILFNVEEKPESGAVRTHAFQSAKNAFAEQTTARRKNRKFLALVILASVIPVIGALLIGSRYTQNKSLEQNMPVLSAPFASEKLSTTGRVIHARLTPDGKNVVYVNGLGGGKQSVWLRQLDNGNNIEIIPPSDDFYAGIAFSPDGTLLYFVRQQRLSNEPSGVYRVSLFGGVPVKITSGTEGWTSISPDGTKISFVRCPRREDEYCSLWIADSADGKNERKLVSRPRPFRIGDNRFSPDGKTIAFAAGQSENSGNEFGLAEVDLETGAERELTSEKFFNIKNLVWLPDNSGWLITASRSPSINSRFWRISAATGEAVPLSKDSENYGMISLDREATKIVSTQVKGNFHLRLCQMEVPSVCKILASATSASIAPDGKIYFSSNMSGSHEIWSIDADGNNQRQLTNNAVDVSLPIVSLDNNSVFFSMNHSGSAQVWRMSTDGSNQTQITQNVGGYPLSVSPDGEWVYYLHGVNRTLWRVSVKGGGEHLVLDKAKPYFSVSPDGMKVAFSETQGEKRILTVVSLADGQPIKTFDLAEKNLRLLNIVWLPGGKNLLYLSSSADYENNELWEQSLDGETPRRIGALGNGEVRSFGFGPAISPDGKTFVAVQGEWLHDAVLLRGLQ